MKEEKVLTEAVIVFPVRKGEVLLARKAYKIGAGCWNGYGGGVEKGESIIDAGERELREESGLTAHREYLEKRAEIRFHNTKTDGIEFICTCHVFVVKRWRGKEVATDEMQEPTWFKFSALPFFQMMPADQAWLPHVLAGKKIVGDAWYGPHQKKLLRPVEIQRVSHFNFL